MEQVKSSCTAPIFEKLRHEVPNPRQREFFRSTARHTAYGGARGGGKSFAMRRKLVLLAMRYPGLRLLLLRRTLQELRENHLLPLQSDLLGYAEYKRDERTFLFPNGARLTLGYCDSDSDVLQYQGAEYDVIGFEEATHFKEDWLIFISTSLRTTKKGFIPRIYYTCNPGGVGHAYIKRLFIDRRFREGENPDDYRFIPARVYDNKVLMEADPDYVKRLEALPEHKRRAHLEGDWNVYEGQVFEELRVDPTHFADRLFTHVIEPFQPPDSWPRYRSFDFGYAKPFSVGWWAKDGDGRLYRILELYGCVPREANVGVRWTPEEIFREILRIEREHPFLKGKHIEGVADPAIWDASRGESIAQTGERFGVYFEKGDNRRVAGWMQIHNRLAFDERGIPMLYIFSSCREFLRTLPILQYSRTHPEDVDSELEDHIADETRYLCMRIPIRPAPQKRGLAPVYYDPLDRPVPQYALRTEKRESDEKQNNHSV
ncbi:MAG: Terminase-like family protein [Ruminococcaceae bacterium]|nr:Terminase-like family protein [Oscillospiraceae bacterium]